MRRVPGRSGAKTADADRARVAGPVALSGGDGENTTRLSFATSLAQMARARRVNPTGERTSEERHGARCARPGAQADGFIHRPRCVDRGALLRLPRASRCGVRSNGPFRHSVLWVRTIWSRRQFWSVRWCSSTGPARRPAPSTARSTGRATWPAPMSASSSPRPILDARAAWGSSDNSVNPFGTYEDRFATDRWLAHAKLTGNWRFGQFPGDAKPRLHVRGGASSTAISIRSVCSSLSQTVSLGGALVRARDRLSPEPTAQSTEPLVSITGHLGRHKARSASVGGLAVGDDDFRALAQAGMHACGAERACCCARSAPTTGSPATAASATSAGRPGSTFR